MSIRLIVLNVLFVSLCLFSTAQPEGFTIVSDTAYIRDKLNETATETVSINTEFSQEKNLTFLFEKIISKGILLYEKPDKLRLEYQEPFSYLLIMNSGELVIKTGTNVTRLDIESNKMFSAINDLIITSIQGTILNKKDMKSNFYENDDCFLVNLLPLNEELKKYIKTIELLISKELSTVTEFKVIEPSDDYTRIRFINKKVNEDIPEDSFDLN